MGREGEVALGSGLSGFLMGLSQPLPQPLASHCLENFVRSHYIIS